MFFLRPSPKPPSQQRKSYRAVEHELHLSDVIRVTRGSQTMYALANAKGQSLQIVHAFDVEPLHESALEPHQLEAIQLSLKEIGRTETLTCICQSFASATDRQQQLDERIEQTERPELQFLLYGERHRIGELAAKGERRAKRYIMLLTQTISTGVDEAEDLLEQILLRARAFYERHFSGEETEEYSTTEILDKAFAGWRERYKLLTDQMGLEVRPWTGEDYWDYMFRRFHGRAPEIPLPHCLSWDGEQLRNETYRDCWDSSEAAIQNRPETELHITSQLFPEEGVPQAYPDATYLPERGCWVGIQTFEVPPSAWVSEEHKFRWLWDQVISHDGIVDLEIVTQIGGVNASAEFTRLQRYANQNVKARRGAQERGDANVGARFAAEQAEEAQESFFRGDLPVYVGFAIIAYATSRSRLKEIQGTIAKPFKPAKLRSEQDYNWRAFLQTHPGRWERLFGAPQDDRLKHLASEAVGYLQLVGVRSRFRDGIEFVSESGGSPIYLRMEDSLNEPAHGVCHGITGSGKTSLVAACICQALAEGKNCTILDLAKGNGISGYSALVDFLGGAEFNTGRTSNNILEKPDLESLPPAERPQQEKQFRKSITDTVKALALMDLDRAEAPIGSMESVIAQAVETFYDDPQIAKRCQAARTAGLGSQAWQDWPTLHDFYQFLSLEALGLEGATGEVERALEMVRLKIREWLGQMGATIAQPSSFDSSQAPLVLFSMSDPDDKEAAVQGLSATAVAMRRAFRSRRSFLNVDEASELLKHDRLAHIIGGQFATSRSVGQSLMLQTQDPEICATCASSNQILNNLQFKLIGRITKGAISSYQRVYGYEHESLVPNLKFEPDKQRGFTRWLLDDGGLRTRCRLYLPYNLLALVASGRNEVAARERFYQEHGDKFEAIGRFAQYLMECNRKEVKP